MTLPLSVPANAPSPQISTLKKKKNLYTLGTCIQAATSSDHGTILCGFPHNHNFVNSTVDEKINQSKKWKIEKKKKKKWKIVFKPN